MKFLYLTHSLRSCWNHGNAHFVRGLVRALKADGHAVEVLEPAGGWSLTNLRSDAGENGAGRSMAAFPELESRFYRTVETVVEEALSADVVIVHEWTDAAVVRALGAARDRGGRFLLFFHDTHHRAASDPETIDRKALESYDAVLAFGESLSEIYRAWGFTAFTWHEAADISHFYPRTHEGPEGAVWIGNWGDGERTAELDAFLFEPIAREGIALTVRGVRYPPEALERLHAIGAHYGGWIANADVPALFAAHRFTMHVPRAFYTTVLPGIPTIRPFEAMACGIPLISAWWPDEEGLFRGGQDYLVARDGMEARQHMRAILADADLRRSLIDSGLETIRARHTCGHRAAELLDIIGSLARPAREKNRISA